MIYLIIIYSNKYIIRSLQLLWSYFIVGHYVCLGSIAHSIITQAFIFMYIVYILVSISHNILTDSLWYQYLTDSLWYQYLTDSLWYQYLTDSYEE